VLNTGVVHSSYGNFAIIYKHTDKISKIQDTWFLSLEEVLFRIH